VRLNNLVSSSIYHRANNLPPNSANHKGLVVRALSGTGSENSTTVLARGAGPQHPAAWYAGASHVCASLSSFLASSPAVMAQTPQASTTISCARHGYACLSEESRVALAINCSDLPSPSSPILRRSVSECAHRWFPLPSCRASGPLPMPFPLPPSPSARARSGEDFATRPRMLPTSSPFPTPNPRLVTCALRPQSP